MLVCASRFTDMVEDATLGAFMSSCKSLQWSLVNLDDVWLSRLTSLTGLYSGLAGLECRDDESSFEYYAQCRRALQSAEPMARRHMKNRCRSCAYMASFAISSSWARSACPQRGV